jgi:tripeptidyl-peptidase-1
MLRLNASYALPAELAQHVDFVGPTTRFPVMQRLRRSKAKAEAGASATATTPQRAGRALFGPSGDTVDPTFLRTLYNAASAKGAAGTKNILAMGSFLGQFYSPDDLAQFFTKYAQDAKVTKPTLYGPNTASQPGIEAELDVQYAMGVGRDIPAQFWSTAGQQPGNPQNEPFSKWLVNLANVTDDLLPLSMSVSYGDNEPGVDLSYADRVDVEFQKAGVRGTSLLFSSGDGGVSGGQSQPCNTFVPTWPAGSIWVTAVGGTTKSKPEVCASFSSGGFSNYFGRPAYQDAAVKGYLGGDVPGIPATSMFNSSGAGIPDVSAQGENFEVIYRGGATPVDGTSCSAPTFNGIVALLNEARLAAGKKSMGYLNPWIYKTAGPAGAFNDVTKGSNPGCDTQGFPAAKGWDPVTG